MHKLIKLGFIFGLLFSINACNLLTADDDFGDYPTSYQAIEKSELEQMNSEYQEANNGRICSTLNQFGFTGFSEVLFEDGQNPCEPGNREVVRIAMNDPDTLLSAARRALFKNSEFTGVTDTSALKLKEMLPLPGCINCGRPDEYVANIEWKLTFDEQQIDSVLVKDTEITVVVDAKGVNRIWGNWYSGFKIPEFVNYGYLEVQKGIVGWQIDMRKYTGEEMIYTIRSGDVIEQPTRIHLPVEDENGSNLEIRTCWAVPVSYEGPNFEGWIAYIDIDQGILVRLKSKEEIPGFFKAS